MSQRLLSWRRSGVGRAETRIHYQVAGAADQIAEAFARLLHALCRPETAGLAFVCIGTDRSTGDALGPVVGRTLKQAAPSDVIVLGTLDEPVHAGNLSEYLADLEAQFPRHAVIAVDACLGKLENVGTISLGRGCLQPGAGVNKQLPAVGDGFITGTVNVGGFMEYFVLQNTRLSLVMQMAETISAGLLQVLTGHPTLPQQTGASTVGLPWTAITGDVASTRELRPQGSSLPH